MVRRISTLLVILTVVCLVTDADARRRRRRARRPAFGTLQITSLTKGAKVAIDGQEMGTLPLEEPLRLKAGKHTLKITKKGYTEYLDVFTVRRGKATNLDIDLLPYAGVLQVSADTEQARVFVDGKFVGTTPLEEELLIGERTIRVRKAGYYEYIGKVKAVAGKVQRIHVTLKPMPVGTTPYRPPPPPPAKWYEKWYVWAGGAAAVAAVTAAIVVPVVLLNKDDFGDYCDNADLCIRK